MVPQGTDNRFRPDLEGLRGVAILLVLAFHAGLPGVSGGFVGVDVFFVLSGFLITGLLLRERVHDGHIDLLHFYVRRARRILPAALAVIGATLVVSTVVLAPLDLPRVAADAVASALSIGNVRFAAGSMDYFAAEASPSPFLHYWSLGVEEQFYLLWPTLLILVTSGRARPRVAAGVAMVVVLLVSLAASIYVTGVSAPWAFYSLPTRAWQLALGGLLAVSISRVDRVSSAALVPISWLGLAAIVASAALLDSTAPYPGIAALLPTIGAAGVVLGGNRASSVGAVLIRAPLRFLGRISYSLYLVHWPILVLASANVGIDQELPLGARLALVVVSVIAATASCRWIEEPIHRGRRLVLPPVRTLALAGSAVALTVVFAAAVGLNGSREAGQYEFVSARAGGVAEGVNADADAEAVHVPIGERGGRAGGLPTGPGDGPSGRSSVGASGGSLGSHLPVATPTARPSATPNVQLPSPNVPQPLPPDVRPSLVSAQADQEILAVDGCSLGELQVQPASCVFGRRDAQITVALVGDSHAAQWFPAVEALAVGRGWRLVTFTKYDCRFVDMDQYSWFLKREYTECAAWRDLVVGRLQALRPDLVVVAASRFMPAMNPADDDPVRQGQALARVLDAIPGRKAILVDTPRSETDVPSCISSHLGDVRPCDIPRALALTSHHRILEAAAAQASGATLVDLTPQFCDLDQCFVVLNGMIVYRDNNHLTATFAASLAGALGAALPDLAPEASNATPPVEASSATSAAAIGRHGPICR